MSAIGRVEVPGYLNVITQAGRGGFIRAVVGNQMLLISGKPELWLRVCVCVFPRVFISRLEIISRAVPCEEKANCIVCSPSHLDDISGWRGFKNVA